MIHVIIANTETNSATVLGWTVIALFTLGGLYVLLRQIRGEKDGRTVSNDGSDPLKVRFEDHFVTRREFDGFKSEVRLDVTEIKGLFHRTMDKIDERDKAHMERLEKQTTELTAKIEKTGEYGYKGRQALHKNLNETREKLAALEIESKNCPKKHGCEHTAKG